MTRAELYSSIASGEDSFTEFKHDLSQRSDFASAMIAFATRHPYRRCGCYSG